MKIPLKSFVALDPPVTVGGRVNHEPMTKAGGNLTLTATTIGIHCTDGVESSMVPWGMVRSALSLHPTTANDWAGLPNKPGPKPKK